MGVQRHLTGCARAHELASIQLDGELARLDQRWLDAHLARCSACREFVESAEASTRLLRTSLPQAPELQFRLPRTRRRLAVSLQLGAAAAAALVAVIGLPQLLKAGSASPHRSAASIADSSPAYLQSPEFELSLLPRTTQPTTRPHVRMAQ